MKLSFRFFSDEKWSFYGTLNVLVPFILFVMTNQTLDSEALIFMSLLGMMDGDLKSKIIFTGFLNFLVYKPTKEWIMRSILFVISVYIMNYFEYENKLHLTVMKNKNVKMFLRLIIFIWMVYILSIILLPYKKWNNILK